MFMYIYKKSTKHIVSFRSDTSTPTPESPEFWLSIYIKDNKVSAADAQDLTFVETDFVDMTIDINQYKWNESTRRIEADPSYVPPPPPTAPEPTPTV